MREIVPGIHHWTAFRDTIGTEVSSYWIESARVLVDPMVPDEGLKAFEAVAVRPEQVVLTTGLHTREAQHIADALEIPIRAPREATERLGDRLTFEPYTDREELAPGVHAVHIDVLCPDEYALHVTVADGAVSFADGLHHYGGELGFFDDYLLGDDPEAVKRGLTEQLSALLERDFAHLLFAHGDPIVGDGRRVLREFVESRAG
jgi:hypothetical protein